MNRILDKLDARWTNIRLDGAKSGKRGDGMGLSRIWSLSEVLFFFLGVCFFFMFCELKLICLILSCCQSEKRWKRKNPPICLLSVNVSPGWRFGFLTNWATWKGKERKGETLKGIDEVQSGPWEFVILRFCSSRFC